MAKQVLLGYDASFNHIPHSTISPAFEIPSSLELSIAFPVCFLSNTSWATETKHIHLWRCKHVYLKIRISVRDFYFRFTFSYVTSHSVDNRLLT